MAKVYALFVGIDKYQPPVKALEGSVADIAAMEALFATRIPPASLELKTLRDDAATRAAIIDGFRSHLRQAGSNDVALFYYCGHGSQEPCPSEWLHIEPSGKNQTLIPVDARTGDVFDIADKELSALIHEVASGGAQVVVITDSCNSGGNTRAADDDTDPLAGVARMVPAARCAHARSMIIWIWREPCPTRLGSRRAVRPRRATLPSPHARAISSRRKRRGITPAGASSRRRSRKPSARSGLRPRTSISSTPCA